MFRGAAMTNQNEGILLYTCPRTSRGVVTGISTDDCRTCWRWPRRSWNRGDEDLAIAALLHDSVEDQGGKARLEDVRNRFCKRVAHIDNGGRSATLDHSRLEPRGGG